MSGLAVYNPRLNASLAQPSRHVCRAGVAGKGDSVVRLPIVNHLLVSDRSGPLVQAKPIRLKRLNGNSVRVGPFSAKPVCARRPALNKQSDAVLAMNSVEGRVNRSPIGVFPPPCDNNSHGPYNPKSVAKPRKD